jgi:hypothetical protein
VHDLKSIWESQNNGDSQIKTRISTVNNFEAYAATNKVTRNHLFLLQIGKETIVTNVKFKRFKGVAIYVLDFGEFKELTIILLDENVIDIFTLFIENIIEEINKSASELEALSTIEIVIARWKRLFEKINVGGLTIEQQKGLFGELLVIRELLQDGYSAKALMEAWVGPKFHDKDFLFNSIGIEVKLTTLKHPSIKITNEGQLNDTNLDALYLVLYIVDEVKGNGTSLVNLIEEIRSHIMSNSEVLSCFNSSLGLLGYEDEDSEYYNMLFSVREINRYQIQEGFPRIIQTSNLSGVFNISYSIELSACELYKLSDTPLKKLING